jgi:hypothetical protein
MPHAKKSAPVGKPKAAATTKGKAAPTTKGKAAPTTKALAAPPRGVPIGKARQLVGGAGKVRLLPETTARADQVRLPMKISGPAVGKGQIDIKDYVPLLESFSTLLRATCRAELGDEDGLQVQVVATESGSFIVNFVLSHLPTAAQTLSGINATAVANTLGIAGDSGLLGLMRFLRGKQPTKVDHLPGAMVKVSRSPRASVVVNLNTYNLFLNDHVRGPVSELAGKLSDDAVQEISFQSNSMKAGEAAFYRDRSGRRSVNVTESSMVLRVVTLDLEGRSKWTCEGLGMKMKVRLMDTNFLRRVRNGEESFAQGDLIRATLRISQSVGDDGKISTEYESGTSCSMTARNALRISRSCRGGNRWSTANRVCRPNEFPGQVG